MSYTVQNGRRGFFSEKSETVSEKSEKPVVLFD